MSFKNIIIKDLLPRSRFRLRIIIPDPLSIQSQSICISIPTYEGKERDLFPVMEMCELAHRLKV
jgi:hypothetical protein